jgi:hypothetical protein
MNYTSLKLNAFPMILSLFVIAISSCNALTDSETKFFEIPPDHDSLLTVYAKSKIKNMPSVNNTAVKLMSSEVFLDSSMLPISEITFDNGLEMTIQAFYRSKFTFDSTCTIKQYSKNNIGVISYMVLGSSNDERLVCMESGDYIDHLTIRSIPESDIITGENFLSVSLNDMKSFSYELNHSGINSFVLNRKQEEGMFSFVLLNRLNKVYLITFSNKESITFDVETYLELENKTYSKAE